MSTQETPAPRAEAHGLVVINAPGWFEREDFLAWLRNPANTIATWDRGGPETNFADVFMTYDGGTAADGSDIEGSDFGGNPVGHFGLPDDIEAEVKRLVAEHRTGPYGVVWIKPHE